MEIESLHRYGNLYWPGCYTSFRRWDNYVTNESYAHPAKMSPKLCEKIFKHLKKHGLLKESDIICDFMAGIGTTNIIASLHRMKSISIELEPHFIEMEKEVKEKLENSLGKVDWEIVQGDSRNLSEIIKERCVGLVSPPYSNLWNKNNTENIEENVQKRLQRCTEKGEIETANRIKRALKGEDHSDISKNHRYSSDPQNIGNLPDKAMVGIISPPYSESQSGGGIAKKGYTGKFINIQGNPDRVGDRCGYVREKHILLENIANLPDKVIGIVSPPFENSEGTMPTSKFNNIDNFVLEKSEKARKNRRSNYASPEAIKRAMEKTPRGYEASKNNIGNQQGETYLEAMFKVYTEAFNTGITPLVVVTKNPTRDGKLRRLDIDTANLLMAARYEIIDYHRAVLFKEQKYRTLDGKIIKHPKGRVGFFKRLAYQKGSEIAQWEDVFFAVIPSVSDIAHSKQEVMVKAIS